MIVCLFGRYIITQDGAEGQFLLLLFSCLANDYFTLRSVTTYNRAAAYDWSITSPSDALLEFCVENNLPEIRLNRNDVMSIAVGVGGTHAGTFTGTAGRKPSSTRKYICPCCGMSVRATRNVNVACLDCNEPLVIAA